MNRSSLLRTLVAPLAGAAVIGAALVAVAPTSSAEEIGTLTLNGLSTQGSDFSMTTSGPCPSGTHIMVKIANDATVAGNTANLPDPPTSAFVVGNTQGTAFGGISSEAFTVPASATISNVAADNGLLVGGVGQLGDGYYALTLTCRTALSSTSLGDFVGRFRVQGTSITPVLPAEGTQTVVTTDAASDTAQWGAPVTVTATVSSTVGGSTNVPTGSVQFKADGTNVGSPVTLTSGVATTSVSSLSIGGHTLSAVYTPSGSFNASTSADKSITIVLTAVPTLVLPPSLSGARVGSTATCVPGTWNLATSYQYEFLIAGAVVQTSTTSRTRVVVPADLGKAMACRVTAINPNGSSTPATTAAVAVAAGPAAVATTKPRIVYSGTPVVGKTFTANRGVWSPSATYSYYYIWKRGSTIVKQGSTATSYRASSLDKGKTITLTVQAKRTGYATGTAVSAGVRIR